MSWREDFDACVGPLISKIGYHDLLWFAVLSLRNTLNGCIHRCRCDHDVVKLRRGLGSTEYVHDSGIIISMQSAFASRIQPSTSNGFAVRHSIAQDWNDHKRRILIDMSFRTRDNVVYLPL